MDQLAYNALPDRTQLALRWLKTHPCSTAEQVAVGIRMGRPESRYIFGLLKSAEQRGYAQREKSRKTWLWSALPESQWP